MSNDDSEADYTIYKYIISALILVVIMLKSRLQYMLSCKNKINFFMSKQNLLEKNMPHMYFMVL